MHWLRRGTVAGVHGADGEMQRISLPVEVEQELRTELQNAMALWPGTQLEIKGMAFALHYHQAMQHEQDVMRLAEQSVKLFLGLAPSGRANVCWKLNL